MTITVSISDFRNNIADYLARARAGDRIILKDDKKDETVAEVIGKKQFDSEKFWKAMRKTAGVFTAKNHPEWATRAKVEKWLRKTRMNAERNFDVCP